MSSPPPNGGGNGGGCGNDHRKVTTMTMTTTTTADADADADAPRQLQQQQLLPQQQRRNGKRWGVSTSNNVRDAGVGCVGEKQRPGNGDNNDRGGIVPAAGECDGDPGGAALATRRGVLPPGAAWGRSAATKGECQITLKSQADIFWT